VQDPEEEQRLVALTACAVIRRQRREHLIGDDELSPVKRGPRPIERFGAALVAAIVGRQMGAAGRHDQQDGEGQRAARLRGSGHSGSSPTVFFIAP
jgi:hypothetical protein